MSIEKYLDGVEVPQGSPGPYSVKLKYDIRKRLLIKQRNRERLFIIFKYINILLFLLVALIVYKPDYAVLINETFAAKDSSELPVADKLPEPSAAPQKDDLHFLGEGVALGSQQFSGTGSLSRAVPVSTGPQTPPSFQIMELSQLKENTPYMIRKVKGSNDNFIYFVNEIAVGEDIPQRALRIAY